MSSEQIRHAYAEQEAASHAPGFVVCSWSRWIAGILPWLLVVFFAYPPARALYHGTLNPLPPRLWLATALYFVLVFVVVPAFALGAGWILFFILRVGADRITVGRWFGARQRIYRASDITSWRLSDRRRREVPDAKSASVLRIDFADGSWLIVSRNAWNFRKLDAWLRRWAPSTGSVATQALNGPRSTYRFVVRDLAMMFIGLTTCVLLWMVTAANIGDVLSRPLPPPRVGEIALYALWLVLEIVAPFIFGLLGVHFLLREVWVDAPYIRIKQWFRLSQRTYREEDIKFWRVSLNLNPPWWRQKRDSSLVLRFTDGPSVVVMGGAANFHALHEYLRDRAGSRQEVRRAVERKRQSA